MDELKIPANHQVVMPYLMVHDAAKLLDFVKKVFGAEEKYKQLREENKILHAEVSIGNNTIMFCDSTATWSPQPGSLFVYVANADETYQKALANGAVSVMELSDQSYGRSGGVKDPCGNTWWINSVK